MFSALVLATVHATTFPGGDAAALAGSIAEATGQSVVIAVLDAKTFNPFDYDPSDLNGMSSAIRKATELRHAPGTDHVYHPETIPIELVRLGAFFGGRGGPSARNGALPESALSGGMVTLASKTGQSFTVRDLARAPFSKALEYHWTQEPYFLVANVKGMPETDFLKFVAKAVAGRLSSTKKGFKIDLDPEQFRTRAKGLLASIKPEEFKKLNVVDRSDIELAKLALNSASSEQIKQAFETQESKAEIQLGGGQLGLVQDRMRAARENAQGIERLTDGTRPRLQPTPTSSAFDAVSLRFGATLILNASFKVEVEVTTVDPLGRPTGKIRF